MRLVDAAESMPATAQQNEWVVRVLGLPMPGGASDRVLDAAGLHAAAAAPLQISAAPLAPIRFVSVDGLAVWREARDAVFDQMGVLQSALHDTNDPNMLQIAEQALPALSQRLGVQMVVALTEVDTAPTERADAARAHALKVIADYHQMLASDGLIRQLDGNPLGVPVTIGPTLGGALDRIEQALRR